MEHIILEVAIIRFNRIGSEGLSDHSMEDEKLTFVDDDFQSFSSEIQAFLNAQEGNARGLRFL